MIEMHLNQLLFLLCLFPLHHCLITFINDIIDRIYISERPSKISLEPILPIRTEPPVFTTSMLPLHQDGYLETATFWSDQDPLNPPTWM